VRTDVPDHGSESDNQVIPTWLPRRIGPCRTGTGGRISRTCRFSTSPRPGPTRWARTFSYAEEFKTLDVEELKRDIIEVMTTATGCR
jgi:catalase-peroxidase